MNAKGTIESVKTLLDHFSSDEESQKIRYFYRGEPESNEGYKLKPRLLRDGEILDKYRALYSDDDMGVVDLQYALLERFRRYASSHNMGDSFISTAGESPTIDEWLCIAQHHGLPTLLLDWSLHPLIALYFSVRDESKHDQPGKLWYMKLKARKDRIDQTIRLRDKSFNKNVILSEDKVKKKNKLFKIKSEEPRIVVPWVFNKRIEAQYARFTYSGSKYLDVGLEEIDDKNRPWTRLGWYKIPADSKKAIKLELEKLQVHEKSLFPDMDGLARYLYSGGL